MPTAQKDGGKDRRSDHDVGILGHEKDSELETAILRVKATDQIGLRFGHVERQTIGLGKKGNEKNQGNRFYKLWLDSFCVFGFLIFLCFRVSDY